MILMLGALAGPLMAGPFDNTELKNITGVESEKASASAFLQETPAGFHVRVAGYNIAHARGNKSGGLNEIGRRKNLQGIIKLLKKNEIDVVGLTEVSKGDLRAGFQNQPESIAKGLGNFHKVYGENVKVGWFGFLATQGNAVVSRYRILSHTNHALYRTSDKHEQRGCLEALLDLGKGKKLRVFVAHLSLVAEESDKQVREIFDWVKAGQEPVILLGDFNSRPKSGRVKWLSQIGRAHV